MVDTYTNPVYGRDFPDPFVFKFCGEYWAYCTGLWADGRCFGILHSFDLVHWQEVGGALEPLPGELPFYWAPEVRYLNGRFYLYYSVGNETLMEIRVAVADHPAGPFVDSGRKLTNEDFAIDGHVFQDEDGSLYMFYATDYLEHTHIGTGTAVDLMLDPFTLAGNPRPVTRARYDWQVFDPLRVEKGGVRWHTIEGPFVLKYKNLYYEMFSGGNWKNVSYGVSYATAHSLNSTEEWQQTADGHAVLPILRTIPDKVIGPGHNSVVRGPDNRQLYCVYHCWALDRSARVLAIDPLDWAGERMLMLGPTTEPAVTPNLPTINGFSSPDWSYSGGDWSVKDRVLWQNATVGLAEASLRLEQPYFVAELSLRAFTAADPAANFGISLVNNDKSLLHLQLKPSQPFTAIILADNTTHTEWQLPEGFNFEVYHLIRLEVFEDRVKLSLDEGTPLTFKLPQTPTRLTSYTEKCAASFAGFALTRGWQVFFEENLDFGDLKLIETPQLFSRDLHLENYELVVNAKLEGSDGFYPAYYSEQESGVLIKLIQHENSWALRAETKDSYQDFPLSVAFDSSIYQQFRFRKIGTNLTLQWENQPLGQLTVAEQPTRVALYLQADSSNFDMVRVTDLKGDS